MKKQTKTLAIATIVALGFSSTVAHAESLTEALTSAYAHNPNIAAALISVKSTAENIALARAGSLPQVNASIDGAYNWSVVGGTTTTATNLTGNITYSHRLFDNFNTDAKVEQARALTQMSQYALTNAEQNVLLSAVQAYMNVLRDTRLTQLRQENIGFLQAQLNSANQRLDVGTGTRIDVSLAEARLAQAVAAYQSSVASLQVSRASYARWVGHDPQNLQPVAAENLRLPGSLNDVLNSAERSHPAILSAQASIRAAQAGADAARAAFGPTLDLIGQICAIGCFGSSMPNAMSGSIRLTLSVPIYSGGAMGAGARQANLDQIRSEVDALSTRDQVRESAITGWSTLQNAQAQITSAQASVKAGQAVLNGVLQEQDLGQRTILDVLDSRAELTASREILISAATSKTVASYSLLAAMGSLTAVELGLPVSLVSAEGYIASVEDVWADLRAVD